MADPSNEEAPKEKKPKVLHEVLVERDLAKGLGSAPAVEGSVPVIDMAEPMESVAEQMFSAATTVGFFTIINHGIKQELVDGAFALSSAFFKQPKEEKEKQSPFLRDRNAGYEYMSQARRRPDVV